MDLGCLDLCSVSVLEKQGNGATDVADSEKKDDGDSPPIHSKSGKNKTLKGNGLSVHTSVNKSYSQLRKPNRKSSSPLNWFPRKKVDSYLKRKIKLLQEGTSSLDETLGDSNPHYSRVLREKIAVKEAACKAMEARKTAMVEASWCRILKAARIQIKEAEALLQEAEKNVADAFEAAAALGVVMYDRPDCPRKPCEVESSSTNMGGSTTHTVTASFETAFEVDKEVAAAVKAAFIRLANCPSSLNKDEHRDLLRRISQNPDINEAAEEVSECSSDCEWDTDKQRRPTKLIDMMLERLKCLQEEELASLATIVATCGLNAVLLEIENTKRHDFTLPAITREQVVPEAIPSLDKFLVKRMSRLEREVLEAKNRRNNGSKVETKESLECVDGVTIPDLGSSFVKHVSKLEKEIEMAKKTSGKEFEMKKKEKQQDEVPSLDKLLVKHVSRLEREVQEAKINSKDGKENIDLNNKGAKPETLEGFSSQDGLDKILVKPVHRLEKEKKEALALRMDYKTRTNKTKHEWMDGSEFESLDKVLVKKPIPRPKMEMSFKEEDKPVSKATQTKDCGDGLEKILVKHQSRLEKEKLAALERSQDEIRHSRTRREERERELKEAWGGLSLGDSVSNQKKKLSSQSEKLGDDIKPPRARREERERELQEAWGGLSLGNAVKPHLSRLERDKAAWMKADQEEESRTGVQLES